ncbi:uncharacterized protein LOC144026951 isoform X2 [Festucalex cinctus]
MYKVKNRRLLLKQLLSTTVRQIIELFDRTIVEYEEELCRTKEENERRQRELLHAVLMPRVRLPRADVLKVWQPAERLHIKKEDGVWRSQIGEQALKEPAYVNMLPLTGVKSEDGEAQSSELRRRQSEENLSRRATTEGEEGSQLQAGDVAPLPAMDEMMECSSSLKQEAEPLHFRKEDVASRQDADELQGLRHSEDDDMQERRKTKMNSKGQTTRHADNKRFRCSQCGKTYASKTGLKIHTRTHAEEKPFGCTVCHKSFLFRHAAARHMRRHTGVRPFACLVCPRKFVEKCDMIRHMRVHAAKKTCTCPVCGKTFSRNAHLTKHMRTHVAEKSFTCLYCNHQFEGRNSLKFHMTTHTKNEARSRQRLTKEADGKRREVPDSIFAPLSDADLMSSDADRRDHNKERPKTEKKSKGGVTRIDRKPFSCSECAEKFSNNASLRRHMKAHRREAFYMPNLC